MRAGQFIQSGIRGFEREEALKKVSKILPVSIALFRADYRDAEDLSQLIHDLNRLYRIENGVPEPIISIDQEGGNVVRLPWLNYSPSNLFLGKRDNIELTSTVGMLAGYDLQRLGIKWNLAPVLDVLNSYNQVILERSFGEDVELISRHGEAYIKGIQSYGVAATAKHFPGHGGVLEDSHLTLPHDTRGYDAIINDAFPFRSAVSAGVKTVMLSHVLYESVDPDFPASLSLKVQELARKEFQFEGVLVTDSVDMHAIRDGYSPEEIVKYSVGAGTDLVECATLETSMEMAEYITRIDTGKLKRKKERIESMIPEKTLNFRPPESIVSAFSLVSGQKIRDVRIDPSRHFHVFFLDEGGESKVAEPFSSFEYVEKTLADDSFSFTPGNYEDFRKFSRKNQQIIMVGRNEHIRNRISEIREKSIGNTALFISTSISRDLGVIPEEIGYIAADSSKGTNVVGAIYGGLGLF